MGQLSSALGETVDVLLGNGDGTFQTPGFWPTGNAAVGLSVGDFNGDAMMDIVTSGTNDTLSVLLQTTAAISPTMMNFRNVKIGKSATLTSTLTNIGLTAFSISGIALNGKNKSAFKQNNTCGQSLQAGASCTITVMFRPKSAIYYSRVTVQIRDSVTNAPQQIYIQGTGVN